MTRRNHARVVVLAALVMSLVATLAARSFSLQVLDGDRARQVASDNRDREVVLQPTRGLILDQQGRPLATNRIALDVAVSRRVLREQDDEGAGVLAGLAAALGVDRERLAARVRNCGTPGARPQPDCWNGAAGADPVVARDVGIGPAATVLAEAARLPGVRVLEVPVREYPGATLAAHALGYVGAVGPDAPAQDPGLADLATHGRAGLEAQYDHALRGRAGRERVAVDSAGHRLAGSVVDPAQPGQTLVTTLDARLQQVVQDQLAAALRRARGQVDPQGRRYRADGGAAVVLDVRTGAVLALASAPTYDANVWSGGISSADYARLTDPARGQPLLDRAVRAASAPASTFKVVSTAAALAAGYSAAERLPCPSSYRVGGRTFRNYESRAHGDITLARALEVSCDTTYYRIADELWRRDGGTRPRQPADRVARMAEAFGFGRATGIDLPAETPGRLASRASKQATWEARRQQWCTRARSGYPELGDTPRARYLTRLAAENCTEGMRWRVGDALNAAIGQGDTTASVLQVAVAYAALANGGTVWRPRVARALLNPDGSVARTFTPQRAGAVRLAAKDRAYLMAALRGVAERGTARSTYQGFPLDRIPVAAKTGTGEVFGRQTTSWFASVAPADDPRYVIVMTVSQGGTGSGTSGPSVRAIQEALFGVRGGSVDPARSVLAGGDVAQGLPSLGPDGLPVAPRRTP